MKNTTTLNQITDAINSAIQSTATQAFVIGELLEQAKPLFMIKDKQDTKAWLIWSEESFGIKKASHYNYISIAKVFGDKEAFVGLSIRVLTQLMRDEELVKKAEKALQDGESITTEWVKAHSRTKGKAKAKDPQEESLDNLKKEVARLNKENKALKAKLKAFEEPEANKSEVPSDAIQKAWDTLTQIKKAFKDGYPHDRNIYTPKGRVKASFKGKVHPDKVSHLNDKELIKAYSDFFKSL